MTVFAASLKHNGRLYKGNDLHNLYPGISACFGKGTLDSVTKKCIDNNLNLLYFDHAYFDRGYKFKLNRTNNISNFRIVFNAIHPTKIIDRPSDRFDSFNIEVKDWEKTGKYILICPPTGNLGKVINLGDDWLFNTVKTIRDSTDRAIKIRPKPGVPFISEIYKVSKKFSNIVISENTKDIPINEDLKNCWATVAPASAVSIDGLIKGIPSFCEPIGPAAEISNTDYAKIEYPIYGDRERLFSHLAYCQFNIIEIENGTASDIILNTYKQLNFLRK